MFLEKNWLASNEHHLCFLSVAESILGWMLKIIVVEKILEWPTGIKSFFQKVDIICS